MAIKIIKICDNCGEEEEEGTTWTKGAIVQQNAEHLCEECLRKGFLSETERETTEFVISRLDFLLDFEAKEEVQEFPLPVSIYLPTYYENERIQEILKLHYKKRGWQIEFLDLSSLEPRIKFTAL